MTPLPKLNDGYRVFFCSGGEPVFCDHTGRIRPLTVLNLCRVCEALREEAVKASQDRRERDFIALSTVRAEAKEALDDTMRWRWAAARL
jgi:hypothetical protein